MATMHVGITSDFFARGLKDYANWRWAWVRELAQNSMDCGSNCIHFLVHTNEDGNTEATCWNDGPSMSKEVLLDKFLCLGGTTKTFAGTVGGFGVAKTVIALAHRSYKIETGRYVIEGVGGQFELTEQEPFAGTKTTVVMNGDHTIELLRTIQRFISFAQWDGVFVINGNEARGTLRKGSPRRDLGFAQVYTNRVHTHTMIVRINGIPMFSKSTSLDRCVIVELKGKSDEVLTSNRDGLVEPFSSELSDFVTELAVDKRSALKNRRRGPRYIEYRGTKMCHQRQLDVAQVVQVASRLADEIAGVRPTERGVEVSVGSASAALYHEDVASGGYSTARDVPTGTCRPQRVATLGTNFILKNETDLKVPAYYDPGSGEFSDYSRKLVRIWGRLMIEMHRLFDVEGEFSIGFILDEGEDGATEAEYENGSFGEVYYLNPCKVVEQNRTYSKSFKKRFKLTERDRLVMIALHEFVHGLGLGWHDERYANKLTDMAAKVMKERKRFSWCFQ